jgi:hypothetical protein
VAVYEKQFGNKKIVILDTGNAHHVTLVSKAWGVLYRVNQTSPINARDPQDKINITWSAHLTKDKRYDTILAAEVADQRIKKVIVTNEGSNNNLSSLDELKKQSTVYVEMDVINGYAVHYINLPTSDAGNFVFRGLDEQGNILAKGF